MKLDLFVQEFISEHIGDDLDRLLLSASRFPDIDMPFVVDQIMARRQIREKLPAWYENKVLVFPSKISVEQCSSELTAKYKKQLVKESDIVCDLTGGLGIDSYFISRKAKKVVYMERYESYCEAARHNFPALGADNIEVVQGDATELLKDRGYVDIFYIDPARRGEGNKRVYALSDCEPDLTQILPELLTKASKVIAKLSPMADIKQTLSLLPGTTKVHVLAVKNECKEVLFEIEREKEAVDPVVYCYNITSNGQEQLFTFKFEDEQSAISCISSSVESYLYEPNVSLLKAGAFKSIAAHFNLNKLEINSHLYTSGHLQEAFPGRIFIVDNVYPFSGRLCKDLKKTVPQANITVRNFPLSVDALRERTKIREGGDIYLFATTLKGGGKVFIQCSKV